MIKKKIGIDNNFALKEACKNNDIILTDKGINSQPVSYIDLTGKEKILNSTSNKGWHNGSTVTVTFADKRHLNVIGTEKTRPLHSQKTSKIAVLRKSKREG